MVVNFFEGLIVTTLNVANNVDLADKLINYVTLFNFNH